MHLAEHLHPFFGVQQRNILGRGHHNGPRHRYLLRQGQLDITGSRRHIHDQIIQILPQGLLQQLLQGTAGHGPPPHHGRVFGGEITHGVGLQAQSRHRHKELILLYPGAGTRRHTQHQGLARAINIRIQNTHPCPIRRQGQRQVDRGSGLTHPAFAGGHGNNILYLAHPFKGFALGRFYRPVQGQLQGIAQGGKQRRQRSLQRRLCQLNGIAETQCNLEHVTGDHNLLHLNHLVKWLQRNRIDVFRQYLVNLVVQGLAHSPYSRS